MRETTSVANLFVTWYAEAVLATTILGILVLGLGTLLLSMTTTALRHTTLVGAVRWAHVSVAVWWVLAFTEFVGTTAGWLDRLWHAAAVLSLCPWMYVLGARRPVSRSWTWFVILPMLAVLGLPLATSWATINGDSPYEIEWPSLCGYLIVLVMGAGNYLGTRFTRPATLMALGLLAIVVAGSTARPAFVPSSSVARTIGVALLGLGLFSAARRSTAPAVERDLDRLWIEFRDLFGIVWAKRVMDRVNESLAAASLASRLDLDGLVVAPASLQPSPNPAPADERERAEQVVRDTFSWLLRRFVDPPWAARFGLTLRAAGGAGGAGTTRIDD